MYWGSRQETDYAALKRDNQYLQDQLDDAKRERERQQELARQERNREMDARLREADDWRSALSQQEALYRREAGILPEYDEEDYFAKSADACAFGMRVWDEVEQARADEIAALRSRLTAIEREIELAVADRIEAEKKSSAYRGVADSIRDGDIDAFLNW